jgi:predicted nucleic acid-binding protein
VQVASTRVCIDASVVIALVVPETLSERAIVLWRNLMAQKAQVFAPSLLLYEVTSALRRKTARGLVHEKDAQKALDRALSLDIQLVASPKLAMVVFAFASQFGRLTAYDMFYLALAKKVGEFWTADKHLYNACIQQGWAIVRWLGKIDVA